MKRILVSVFVAFSLFLGMAPQPVMAAHPSCAEFGYTTTPQIESVYFDGIDDGFDSITVEGVEPNKEFQIARQLAPYVQIARQRENATSNSSGQVTFTLSKKQYFEKGFDETKNRRILMRTAQGAPLQLDWCILGQYSVEPEKNNIVGVLRISQQKQACCFEDDQELQVYATGVAYADGSRYTGKLRINVGNNLTGSNDYSVDIVDGTSTTVSPKINKDAGHEVHVKLVNPGNPAAHIDQKIISLVPFCSEEVINQCEIEELGEEFSAEEYLVCDQVPDAAQKSQCEFCFSGGGLWTAVGCIERSTGGIVGKVITLGIGFAGGIALLMILAAAFELSISQGEPKRTSEARERLTAAIIGLLFIIFSVTILQFIGVTIFQLPEFGG